MKLDALSPKYNWNGPEKGAMRSWRDASDCIKPGRPLIQQQLRQAQLRLDRELEIQAWKMDEWLA